MSRRFVLLTSGISGLTAVILGAFGAHALHLTLARRGMASVWETAVHYHYVHTLAILAVGLSIGCSDAPASGRLKCAIGFWLAGIVLFSGSLYGLALGGPRILGPVTPLGGGAFIIGWVCVLLEGWKSAPGKSSQA